MEVELFDTMEVELFDNVLTSSAFQNLSAPQRKVMSCLLPVLFDALPELLRCVEKNEHQLNGNLPCDRPVSEIDNIEPIRFVAEYLFRHNPKHEVGTQNNTMTPALRHALRKFAEEKFALMEGKKSSVM
jgi:hypothetical protein